MNHVDDPETGGEPRWWSGRAGNPLAASDPAAVRARFEEVANWWATAKTTDWWAVVVAGSTRRLQPKAVEAAMYILSGSPTAGHQPGRGVSVYAQPATVWDVAGTLVAVYHQDAHGGPAVDADCSCPATGLCEHLLIALAGTELRGEEGESDDSSGR